MKPSNNDFPVDAVNLVPTNKNGYLNRLVRRIRPTNENPNLAPAVVDDIKWEPPIGLQQEVFLDLNFFEFLLIISLCFFYFQRSI